MCLSADQGQTHRPHLDAPVLCHPKEENRDIERQTLLSWHEGDRQVHVDLTEQT